jgi:glycosyltransferase involved in cell wall biosynthesis
MKLLLLADARSVHAERYKSALRKRGIEVILASLEPSDIADIRLDRPTGIRAADYRMASGKVKAIVERERPDIVDAHSASGYGYTAAFADIKRCCPLVVHCLGSDILVSSKKSIFHRKRTRTSLRSAQKVFVDSEFLRKEVAAISARAECEVVYWGAENEIFELYRPDTDLSTDRTTPIRALIPRPHEKIYNNRLIVDALSDNVNEKRLELYFPAWGSEIAKFNKLADKLCPSGGISFYPRMPRGKYIGFLGTFDLYISASLSDSSPASLIEAMAAGLFPMVGDIPGVTELMHESPGLLFDVNKPETLRRLFDDLLSGRLNVYEIRKTGHDTIGKVGHFEDNMDRTIQIMVDLIKHERRT